MRVACPPDWTIERLSAGTSVFATRINDGEMIQMYRTKPEGELLGTVNTPAYCHYDLGDALRQMVYEMGGRNDCLLGCSWNTPRADKLCELFELDLTGQLEIKHYNWCHEHWPLEGVVDGSTVRLLELLRQDADVVLVTCSELVDAGRVLDCPLILAPSQDSWTERETVYRTARYFAKDVRGCVFVWAAGCGLKPTAWQLFKEFPKTSHIDIGHLFNGALGLADYGWLQRKDGPWYESYLKTGGFKDYVQRFIK